jgi:hypothetical protein
MGPRIRWIIGMEEFGRIRKEPSVGRNQRGNTTDRKQAIPMRQGSRKILSRSQRMKWIKVDERIDQVGLHL